MKLSSDDMNLWHGLKHILQTEKSMVTFYSQMLEELKEPGMKEAISRILEQEKEHVRMAQEIADIAKREKG